MALATSSSVSAALLLFLVTIGIHVALARGASSMEISATQYWEENLGSGVPMPLSLQNLVSTLTTAEASEFENILFEKKQSLGNLCKVGNLYCSATDFAAFRKVSPVRCLYLWLLFGAKNIPIHYETNAEGKKVRAHQGYFRENQLVKNAQMMLYDQFDYVPIRPFLPRRLSRALPFNEAEVPSLLRLFDIPTGSQLAKEMGIALHVCKPDAGAQTKGEKTTCTTSLEDMVDFVKTRLMNDGKSVELLTASATSKNTFAAKIVDLKLKATENTQHVVCHDVMYPYATNFCHYIPKTRVYEAKLQTEDGTLIQNVAMCHLDTSSWNPMHVAFYDLNSKPGMTEACHWIQKRVLIFIPRVAV